MKRLAKATLTVILVGAGLVGAGLADAADRLGRPVRTVLPRPAMRANRSTGDSDVYARPVALAFAPDGKSLTVVDGDAIHVYDTAALANGSASPRRTIAPPKAGDFELARVETATITTDARTAFVGAWRFTQEKLGNGLIRSGDRSRLAQVDLGRGTVTRVFTLSPDGPWVFSSDGSRLVTGGNTNPQDRTGHYTVELWETAGAKKLSSLAGLEHHLYDLAFAGPAVFAAVAGEEGLIRVELGDAPTKRTAKDAAGASVPACHVLALPGGRVLASLDDQPRLCIWDPASGDRCDALPSPIGVVSTLALFPDGKRAALASDEGVAIVALDSKQILASAKLGGKKVVAKALAVAPANDALVVATGNGKESSNTDGQLLWIDVGP